MTTWDELLKNRIPMPSMRNSAHMLKLRAAVLARYSDAQLVEAGPGMWKLVWSGQDISNPHTSHYECWIEAYKLMERAT
jgi:hypothetical protein